MAAAVFGLVLLGLGEYARAGRLLSDDPRIAQALVGAGIAVLYAAAYGSHSLYGLIGSGAAAAAMLAITGAALGLSLRHGAPTAVMGLIGGFLTPALVGDSDSGPVPLLAYLGLLDLAIFLIAWRRGWTWLAAAAVTLSFLWSAFLLFLEPEDALASGQFVIALAIAASLARPGDGRSLGLIQPLLIGIVLLAFVAARTDLGFLGWLQFGALAAASLVLAALRKEYRAAPPVALALGLLVLLGKAGARTDPFVLEATAAEQRRIGQPAIGLHQQQRCGDPRRLQRFRNEALAAAQLDRLVGVELLDLAFVLAHSRENLVHAHGLRLRDLLLTQLCAASCTATRRLSAWCPSWCSAA